MDTRTKHVKTPKQDKWKDHFYAHARRNVRRRRLATVSILNPIQRNQGSAKNRGVSVKKQNIFKSVFNEVFRNKKRGRA